MAQPWLWLIAGPNGSGKSTIASSAKFHGLLATPEEPPIEIINPDAIRARLAAERPDVPAKQLDRDAAIAADNQLRTAIAEHRAIGRETVLSTNRLLEHVTSAKAQGFRFGLVYVLLRDPELNIRRVAARVAAGGHDVDPDKIRSRWVRSIEILPRFAALADTFLMFDNSEPGGTEMGRFGRPKLLIECTPTTAWIADLETYAEAPAPLPATLETLREMFSA